MKAAATSVATSPPIAVATSVTTVVAMTVAISVVTVRGFIYNM